MGACRLCTSRFHPMHLVTSPISTTGSNPEMQENPDSAAVVPAKDCVCREVVEGALVAAQQREARARRLADNNPGNLKHLIKLVKERAAAEAIRTLLH